MAMKLRVFTQVDGRLEEDRALTRASLREAAPSPRAVAAGRRLHQGIESLAARNRAALDTITDEDLKRSVLQGG